ncbi:MAG: hypothetical protein Q7L55_01100 [Actinomycetota bacterium]|nr:hypothetical protein [Actinomycetota bacterium]
MASRRTLSVILAWVATVLLLAWNLFHDQFLGSVLLSFGWFAIAVAVGTQAVRLAWITPSAEVAIPRS